jgi:hypothetical protein
MLTASTVALAPATMGVLLEAQERVAAEASALTRQTTARKLDQLIARLEGDPPPPSIAGVAFAVRRLQLARDALA